MNRRLATTFGFCAFTCAVLGSRVAGAQVGGVNELAIGYMGLPQKAASEAPNGIQLADGVVMHVGAGAESGYDTNVFYQDANSPYHLGSGIIRATGFAQIGNATRTGQAPAGMSFSGGAGLQYRRYMSDSPFLNGYRNAFMPTAHLSLGVNSGQFGFSFVDSFVRLEDAPYNPGQQSFIRDNNVASAEGRWAPGGGRLTTALRYSNYLDIYEDASLKPSSSVTHQLLLDVSWKWLPKTAVFVQASQGYITYLYDTSKTPSWPLRAFGGLRGLITPRVAALLALGYVNGFYSDGTSTSGVWGSTYLQAQATITPTLVSRVVVGYKHDFANSVVSNFSYDDSVYASYAHQIAGRVSAALSARYMHRQYEGNIVGVTVTGGSRVDNLITGGASVDYYPRNWIYLGVGYALFASTSNATIFDATTNTDQSLDYVKQQIFARLGVTY